MYPERQRQKAAEKRLLYAFLSQFKPSNPGKNYPFDDYPNGFMLLVIFALAILGVGFLYKMV